jgi:hypothetical protein
MNTPTTLQPDSRGRLALGTLIDRERTYLASRHEDGSVLLTPVAHVLTDEQYADLQADPKGFADMLSRSRAIAAGAPTVSVEDFLADLD